MSYTKICYCDDVYLILFVVRTSLRSASFHNHCFKRRCAATLVHCSLFADPDLSPLIYHRLSSAPSHRHRMHCSLLAALFPCSFMHFSLFASHFHRPPIHHSLFAVPCYYPLMHRSLFAPLCCYSFTVPNLSRS